MPMKLKLLFFASHREAAGKERMSFEMPDGSTAGQLLDQLVVEHPAFKELEEHTVMAVNHEQVGRDRRLSDGDEVAFYPPVSGG
jgi:molybdopterin converting factor subunit 1